MDYAAESLKLHYEWQGKIEVTLRAPLETADDLSLAYTPGVAQPCLEIQKDVSKSYDLTRRGNLVVAAMVMVPTGQLLMEVLPSSIFTVCGPCVLSQSDQSMIA